MKIKPQKYIIFKGKIKGKRKVHTAYGSAHLWLDNITETRKREILCIENDNYLQTTALQKKKSDECRNDNNLKQQTLETTDVGGVNEQTTII